MDKELVSMNKFYDKVENEYSWRRKEIFNLERIIKRENNEEVKNNLIRATIVLLYAHLEGFIKESSMLYIYHLSLKKINLSELPEEIKALFIINNFNLTSGINFRKVVDLVKEIESFDKTAFTISKSYKVNTKSNLNFKVFSEILTIIGLDEKNYINKKGTVDLLVELRNNIAHGEYREVSEVILDGFKTDIEILLQQYKDEIQNLAMTKSYLKNYSSRS